MIFFFCREENPLVTNEPHIATRGIVAVHGEPPFCRVLLRPAFYFEPGAHCDAPLGGAVYETQSISSGSFK